MKKRKPFQFKNFTIHQENVALPVTTDACIFGSFISQEIDNNLQIENIIDLGTGTGLLLFFINQTLPEATILGIEKDTSSFETACSNLRFNNAKNMTIINEDFFDWGYSINQKFDLIVSNPPFFENQLVSADPHKRQARHFSENGFNSFFELIGNLVSETGSAWIMLPFIPFPNLENLDIEKESNVNYWKEISSKGLLKLEQSVFVMANENKKPHLIFTQWSKKQHPFQTSSDSFNTNPPKSKQIIVYQNNRVYTKECFDLLEPFYNFSIFGT
jgi:tRNA1Val (adenine37-N6)-methyltransferase